MWWLRPAAQKTNSVPHARAKITLCCNSPAIFTMAVGLQDRLQFVFHVYQVVENFLKLCFVAFYASSCRVIVFIIFDMISTTRIGTKLLPLDSNFVRRHGTCRHRGTEDWKRQGPNKSINPESIKNRGCLLIDFYLNRNGWKRWWMCYCVDVVIGHTHQSSKYAETLNRSPER